MEKMEACAYIEKRGYSWETNPHPTRVAEYRCDGLIERPGSEYLAFEAGADEMAKKLVEWLESKGRSNDITISFPWDGVWQELRRQVELIGATTT